MTLWLLKITLLLLLGLTLAASLRKASASTRHLVIAAALAASVLMPGLLQVVPAWKVLPTIGSPAGAEEASPSRVRTEAAERTPEASPLRTPSPAVSTSTALHQPSLWERSRQRAEALYRSTGLSPLTALWMLGALGMIVVLIARLAATHRRVRRATREENPALVAAARRIARELGIRQDVSIARLERGAMPMVWGLARPVVLLPEDARAWPDERLHAVLGHELAHVARRDLAAILLGHLACAVHWFHPLAWLLQRKLATEREIACDEIAIRAGIPARSYATHLLDIAASCGPTRSLAPVLAARSQLEGRIMAILDTRSQREPKPGASLIRKTAFAALGLAVTVSLATLDWAGATPSDQATATIPAASDSARAAYNGSDVARFQVELRRSNVSPSDIPGLLEGLRSDRKEMRAASAWALGEAGDQAAVPELIEALEDRWETTREWAARSLGKLDDPRAVDPLIDRLDDPNAAVRQWAARSLADLDDPKAAIQLAGNLDDPDAESRQWAARALGSLRDPRAVASLIDHIGDPDAEVRQWIARALADIGDPRAVEAFRELLDDPDPEVQEWAVRGLGSIGAAERNEWVWDPNREEPLMPGLDALAPEPGDPASIDALVRSLDSNHAEVRQWGARSLGNLGDARAVRPLIDLTRDPDDEVREWAVRVLGTLRATDAVPALIGSLEDDTPDVRQWAIRTLGAFQDPRLFAPVSDRLTDDDAEVREWAARALGALGDPRAIELLQPLLDDEEKSVRRWTRKALEALASGDRRAASR